jgi:hypothetical protein
VALTRSGLLRPLALVAVVAAFAISPTAAGAPAGGGTTDQPCFGAASRDPRHPCRNPRLRLAVVPTPREAQSLEGPPCHVVEDINRKPLCTFGPSAETASRSVALVGDSHAGHWRPALDAVVAAKGWHGIRIGHASCPLSTALRDLPEPNRSSCRRWKQDVFSWFARHPEVSVVFVSQLTGGSGVVPSRGRSAFATAVDGYVRAWKALPPTVEHIVVIRDTPKARGDTDTCIERAIARRRPAGRACAIPRGEVLQPDPAVAAAARMHSTRVQVVDLTRFFCGARLCFPVIGGALVQKDSTHVTVTFMTTLGSYLLRAVDRAGRAWRAPAQAAALPATTREPCFGAASRAAAGLAGCPNRRLRLAVVPSPREARRLPGAPCDRIRRDEGLSVCEFGVPAERATRTVALVGDSHAGHWRAGFDAVAEAQGWHAMSVTHTSCPLQKALRDLPEPKRTQCARWKRQVFEWFARHPEVSTVFVSGLTAGSGVVPRRSQHPFEARVAGFRDAWRALPPTVEHIVVVRDTPKMEGDTGRCIERAVAHRRPPGLRCAVRRADVLDPDAAMVAARRLRSAHVQTLDMTRVFCGPRYCYPVIGGALVFRDQNHMSSIFAATLGPALLPKVRRLAAAWR